MLAQSLDRSIVYWAGGWLPHNGIALGIALFVDPPAAALSLLTAILTTASFVFSWRYFESVGVLFHSLMLIFSGAMIGFCLSSDLFTIFVFFELMSATAYGLTAYKIENSPLAGSLNFAVTNSVGAFLILIGISMLYGRTGALNLAQVGKSLNEIGPDFLVVSSFVLITSGFLIKAAIVPFHFWLADAHAVAPTPVSVLFSGVMIALGLYGASRVFWTVFSGAFAAHGAEVRAILSGMGAFTAVFGALMCFIQRHLKRLLAFSSISHMGVVLLGTVMLNPEGTSGAWIYAAAHGLIKGALFICTGILLNARSSVDEMELRGRGKPYAMTGILFAAGGLALAGLPPFGTFLGKAIIERSAESLGFSWVGAVLLFSSMFTGGSVLRAAGRIFLGWGPGRPAVLKSPTERETRETQGERGRAPWAMVAPALGLLILAAALGPVPNLVQRTQAAARHYQNQPGFIDAVLGGIEQVQSVDVEVSSTERRFFKLMIPGATSALGAILLALWALFPLGAGKALFQYASDSIVFLRKLHSGHVGDYVAWLMFGVAGFGLTCVFLIR